MAVRLSELNADSVWCPDGTGRHRAPYDATADRARAVRDLYAEFVTVPQHVRDADERSRLIVSVAQHFTHRKVVDESHAESLLASFGVNFDALRARNRARFGPDASADRYHS